MSTNIYDFASLLFWAAIAICVLVCCLEIRKEIRDELDHLCLLCRLLLKNNS